jgi:hypothetical protein
VDLRAIAGGGLGPREPRHVLTMTRRGADQRSARGVDHVPDRDRPERGAESLYAADAAGRPRSAAPGSGRKLRLLTARGHRREDQPKEQARTPGALRFKAPARHRAAVADRGRARAAGTENTVSGRDHARDVTPGILPSALRASLRLFKIAPGDFVEPEDFIARLVALVPKPRANLIRYHGVFAPASPDRARVVPRTRAAAPGKAVESSEPTATDRQRSLNWAQRLKRVSSSTKDREQTGSAVQRRCRSARSRFNAGRLLA